MTEIRRIKWLEDKHKEYRQKGGKLSFIAWYCSRTEEELKNMNKKRGAGA